MNTETPMPDFDAFMAEFFARKPLPPLAIDPRDIADEADRARAERIMQAREWSAEDDAEALAYGGVL